MTSLSLFGRLLCAVCLLGLSACGTVPIDLTNVVSARFAYEEQRHNLACDIPVPWSVINRGSLTGPETPRSLPADWPQAGFSTDYSRGADPVPCERQRYQRVDTVFRFDFGPFLARYHPSQIEVAVLSVEDFQSESDLLIRFAEPWRDTELSSATHSNSTRVPFLLKAVRSGWTPAPNSSDPLPQGRPEIALLREHDLRRSQFWVPLAEGSTPSFIVTDEVRRFFASESNPERNFGFVLEPAPAREIQLYKTHNSLKGAFRMRLRLFVRE